ncbi:MAG: sporulation protein [Firmicutes bacterium]|nr:sporulation protein [Bacillota bacterium]
MENLSQLTEQLENLISSKTVIGDPISVGEVTLVPIIKANFGFGMGSGNTDGVKRVGGAGGGGGAVIVPIAIVAICGKEVNLLVIDKQESKGIAPLLEKLPQLIEKFTSRKQKDDDSEEEGEPESEQ